jgi:hypothetical protein
MAQGIYNNFDYSALVYYQAARTNWRVEDLSGTRKTTNGLVIKLSATPK